MLTSFCSQSALTDYLAVSLLPLSPVPDDLTHV